MEGGGEGGGGRIREGKFEETVRLRPPCLFLDELARVRKDPGLVRALHSRKPTYLPIAPPQFARLSSDSIPHHYTASDLLPGLLGITDLAAARCACGAYGTRGKETTARPCRVYTSVEQLA